MTSPLALLAATHGLLHSGARYSVTDGESARECIEENRILKRIAHHCIERTTACSLPCPQDSLAFQQQFITACRSAGIERRKPLTPRWHYAWSLRLTPP
ncbi:Anaerobic glycerol-3-phosphate dehydrogenase subunit A [Serratia fonticola]|uniref:Anaerobic glycerol-3-phosphate dehydrogenase subunit A n=1 Tax=Serratia fonticola TaxID=47917 RepID=A0A4U9TYM9_SERFO|nr:Anaerobic glycerol-3-phosphate dehydrogenase subunit A [Serratia fonticola]